jgi:cation:H+ antiporter
MGILISFFLTLPWIFFKFLEIDLPPYFVAIFSGLCIAGGAYLLTLSTEGAQIDFAKSLSFAFLALFAVLPEYIVDFYFAWMAPHKKGYSSYALANMTGANRLLIGIGWALVIFLFAIKSKRKKLNLEKTLNLELRALLIATFYAFILSFKNSLTLLDSLIFLSIFFVYIYNASKSHKEEIEETSFLKKLISIGKTKRIIVVVLLFFYAGFCILISGHEFAESLVKTGKILKIEEFLLVQWIAPLASESPEIIAMSIFVIKGKPSSGFNALVSSKVNQWTLLVGTLPIVYAISALSIYNGLHIDLRQKEEIFLTAAQSLFAVIILADFDFHIFEGFLILFLILLQFLFPYPKIRIIIAFLYIILSIFAMFIKSKREGFKENFLKFK